jgi:Spy/CpxP family protein refolding chaperone
MKTKYKILIALTLVVVFGLGIAAGILGERYIVHRADRRAAAARPHMPSPEAWAKELGLTQEQQDKIREIFKKNEERMKAYRADSHTKLGELRKMLKAEIDAVLTPEQKQKNDEMIRRFEEQRKKESERNPARERQAEAPQRQDPPPPDRER